MQLKRLADAEPAVRRREVVDQEQLARTEQDALLDGIQVEPPFGEMVSLLGKRLELHAAQETGAARARQRRRVIGCLD